MGIRWLRLWRPLGWTWQWTLGLWGHMWLLIGWSSLVVCSRGLWRMGLPWVRSWATRLSLLRLGIGGLLLARVRSLARLAIIRCLALGSIASWSLLTIRSHLWAIWHATHASWGTSLHSHWISLRTWRTITLARVTRPLLWTCRRSLLRLLTVWTACSVWLASHFPHWIHGTRRLVSGQRLPGTSRAHGRREMASLLPTRVAPSIQTAAAHVCWSLTSSLLATVVARRVVWICPR